MFEIEKARKFDILLYKPNGDKDYLGKVIDFFQYGGKYCHASIYWGDGLIIESHFGSGVVKKELNPKWYSIIDGYRLKQTITKSLERDLIASFESKIGAGYDLAAFPSTFFRSTVGQFFGWKHFSKDRPFFNNKGHYYCSELEATGFAECGITLLENINPMSVTPSDLGTSKKLKKVY